MSYKTAISKRLTFLPELICGWYDKNQRDLPWRKDKNPYHVWVSEIMLQQTRVEAVKAYYVRFTDELPSIADLAACPEDRLLKLWEGLGYYTRVRHMQEAAKRIVKEHGGQLPSDYQKLLKLPGIGSYTAGAVASIAFSIPVPAVDGNVLRIVARFMADDRDVLKSSVRKETELVLTDVLKDCSRAGDFNQGLMDLGAMVCLPSTRPLCEKCPLQEDCEAHLQKREIELPVRGKPKTRRIEKRTILLIRDGERVALTKRPDKGLLAGMYEFPNLEGACSDTEVLKYVKKQGLEPLRIRPLKPAKHLFSHVEWQMTGFEIQVAEFTEMSAEDNGSLWILAGIREIEASYPIPSAYKAYADHIRLCLGVKNEQLIS